MSKINKVRVSAPGKVILHGEHAVVHYKKAIAISVGLYTTLDVCASSGDLISVKFPDTGIDFQLPLEKLKQLQGNLGPNYSFETLDSLGSAIEVDATSKEILSKFIDENIKLVPPSPEMVTGQRKATESFLGLYMAIFHSGLLPISVEINTELPVGAGLGSSASFAVALAGGLLVYAGRITKDISKKEDLDIVNRWAYLSEKFVHGSPSGIDNHVATYGGAVLFQREQPSGENGKGGGEKMADAISCPEIHVILVNSKVPRSTFELVKKTAKLKEEQYDVWLKVMDNIGNLVEEAVSEIKDRNSIKANLFAKNHELLQTLGVSHPALDAIVELGDTFGFSGKLTGAGGGGCAFIYLQSDHNESDVNKLKSLIQEKGFSLWDTKLGCNGIRVENVE